MARFLYPNASLGPNGGVQLLKLDRMRAGAYAAALASLRGKTLGYLGDQTAYARMSEAHPELFHRLSCRFNRQLSTHFHAPVSAYACAEGCDVLHGNQPVYKSAIQRAAAGDAGPLRSLVPRRLRPAFANCW